VHVAQEAELLERLEVAVDDREVGAGDPPVEPVGELLRRDCAVDGEQPLEQPASDV